MPADGDLELRSRVPADADGMPLIDYLLRRFPYHDRATWLREIAAGRLRRDTTELRADVRVRTGMRLTYRRAHDEPPVDDRIDILHDDAALVVVRKPAHLPMHADGPFVRHTLIHLLQTRLAAPDLQLVHRLDRETSGLCVLARGGDARDALRRQFAAGTVAKGYLAAVRGRAEDDFTVDLPIGRSKDSTITLRRAAGAAAIDGKPARTSFTVLRRGPDRSLLRCTPVSGRTHQIRVHLEAAGLPVLGDKLYGLPDAAYLAFVARVKAGGAANVGPDGEPGRQLLHAAELAFVHPQTGREQRWTDPLPDDWAPWLADLEAVDGTTAR